MWHGYIGIVNVGLNDSQRDTFIDALKALGPKSHQQPACLCHWRTRLDKQAVILEALFNEDNLTINAFRNRLANIFGVDPDTIADSTQQTQYGPLVTFSRNGDRLRFLAFGGKGNTWANSGAWARAYLKANIDDWEEPIE